MSQTTTEVSTAYGDARAEVATAVGETLSGLRTALIDGGFTPHEAFEISRIGAQQIFERAEIVINRTVGSEQ